MGTRLKKHKLHFMFIEQIHNHTHLAQGLLQAHLNVTVR